MPLIDAVEKAPRLKPGRLSLDDKPRVAGFAPSKPQSGLTERHKNQSITARQSRDLLLIFGAADFIGSLRRPD